MSCDVRHKVLRMPGSTVGLNTPEELQEYEFAHEGELNWRPGFFAPALCSQKKRTFIDYYLEVEEPWMGSWNIRYARELDEKEKIRYLPAFQKQFPGFTLAQMDVVHCCEFTWYNGTDAPDLY